MSDYETRAWLGDAAVELSDEQIDTITAAFGAIDERYPSPDDSDTRQLAYTGAAQVLLGDADLGQIADGWRTTRRVERDAMATLTGALIASAPALVTETRLAEEARLNRMTVRKALGK
jgi:hypothetical protein